MEPSGRAFSCFPVACATASRGAVRSAAKVLVYDIGGGTLDTSLLYMNGNAARVPRTHVRKTHES